MPFSSNSSSHMAVCKQPYGSPIPTTPERSRTNSEPTSLGQTRPGHDRGMARHLAHHLLGKVDQVIPSCVRVHLLRWRSGAGLAGHHSNNRFIHQL
jgi:hypothetical protein